MASYQVENDIVGSGGLGGFGGFGGGCGLLVVLLILFAVFSGGGLFGRRDCDGHGHYDGYDYFHGKYTPCDGTSNCTIDKDVLTSRDATILDNHEIYERQLQEKINEKNQLIMEQKNQLYVGGLFAELQESLNCKFGAIERELEHKPNVVPTWAATVDACSQRQLNCGDRFRDGRRDRDDCCFC